MSLEDLFRRDRFNWHWVSKATGNVCDEAEAQRILELARMTESVRTFEPEKSVTRRLKDFAKTL